MISGTCEPLKLCKECWDVSANPHHTHFSEHHTSSSNPTASTGVDRGQTVTCKIAVFWRLARLEKRLDLGCATRNASAARRHAPSCMGATELQRNWPEMRKTQGKPGFCSTGFKKLTERTGTELLGVFSNVFLRIRKVLKASRWLQDK